MSYDPNTRYRIVHNGQVVAGCINLDWAKRMLAKRHSQYARIQWFDPETQEWILCDNNGNPKRLPDCPLTGVLDRLLGTPDRREAT